MLRTPTRLWTVAGIATCIMLAFVTWFFLVSPQREKASASWSEVTAAQLQTGVLSGQVNALRTRFEGIDAARAGLDLKRQSLPATNQLDTLVLALNRAGAATGVTVDAVVPAEPIDITPVPPKEDKDEDEEAPDEEAPADESDTTTVEPEVSAWPLFVLPMTIQVSGSPAAVQNFMRVMQSEQPRAILITSFEMALSLDTLAGAGQVTLIAQANVFVSPAAVVQPVVEAPAG